MKIMATVWATGVVMPVMNGQGLGVRAAAGKKQSPKGGKPQVQQKSEKGFLDRLLEWMDKKSFSETDPVLKKVVDDKGVSVAPPPQKKGGFFGLN